MLTETNLGAGKQAVWSADATCSKLANTCQEYVANNPSAFVDAYWLFNSIDVYQSSGTSIKREAAGGVRRRVEKYRV